MAKEVGPEASGPNRPEERTPLTERKKTFREDALNLPNALTMMRIVWIPLIIYFVKLETVKACVYASLIYGATAITDFLDGYLARRRNLVSLVGKFLDPLADKLLVMALAVVMVELGRVPAWVVIIILARELTITSLRVIAMGEGLTLEASRGGKDKAAVQMVAIGMLILHHTYHLDLWLFSVDANMHDVGLALLYASVYLAVESAVEYMRLFARAVATNEARG